MSIVSLVTWQQQFLYQRHDQFGILLKVTLAETFHLPYSRQPFLTTTCLYMRSLIKTQHWRSWLTPSGALVYHFKEHSRKETLCREIDWKCCSNCLYYQKRWRRNDKDALEVIVIIMIIVIDIVITIVSVIGLSSFLFRCYYWRKKLWYYLSHHEIFHSEILLKTFESSYFFGWFHLSRWNVMLFVMVNRDIATNQNWNKLHVIAKYWRKSNVEEKKNPTFKIL